MGLKLKNLQIFASVIGFWGVLATLVGVQNAVALETAWGPERETYTWAVPASKPVFNSIINNPSLGDERNFVRVREYTEDGTGTFEDYASAEAGKEYEVYVYYHNNASESFNADGTGIAQNVRLKMEAPANLKAGETAVIKGTISWGTEGEMQEVWDTAFLEVTEDLTLSYNLEVGAVIHNQGTANGEVLDGAALFGDGVLLAYSKQYWGIVPGCNEFAGYVTFRLVATGVEAPAEEPEDEPEETPEEEPEEEAEETEEIVNTGPAEITLAVLIVLFAGIMGYYMVKTRMEYLKTRKMVIRKK